MLGVLGESSSSVSAAALAVLILFGLGLLFAVFAGLRRMAMPLGDIIDAAGQVEAGDFSARVQPRGPRELRQLGRAFNDMAERLELTEEQRRNLVADLSHELRTPVSIIQGNLEGMIDGIYAADEQHLAPVLEEVRMLSRLIDDLRTLSEAETGTLELRREPTDFGILATEVANSFRPQANAQEVKIDVDVPDDLPLIEVDPVRIREVLANLTTNALRHTPSGGNVAIGALEMDGYAQVTVDDTGSGIAPEDLDHVFDRFYKAGSAPAAGSSSPSRPAHDADPDRSSRRIGASSPSLTAPGTGPDHSPLETGGRGLGLTIAKNLVAAHGGEIAAESTPGEGTAVRFTLPLEAGID
jgi:two-component system OmpR family sensor kinase/two-component system sensor histidine kinase BaeS